MALLVGHKLDDPDRTLETAADHEHACGYVSSRGQWIDMRTRESIIMRMRPTVTFWVYSQIVVTPVDLPVHNCRKSPLADNRPDGEMSVLFLAT